MHVPILRDTLALQSVSAAEWATLAMLAASILLVTEFGKWQDRRRTATGRSASTAHLILCAMVGAAAALAAVRSPAEAETTGRALVEANCARCATPSAEMTAAAIPKLRLFATCTGDTRWMRWKRHSSKGFGRNPDMPEFVASTQQVEAIIDYIGTLSP